MGVGPDYGLLDVGGRGRELVCRLTPGHGSGQV